MLTRAKAGRENAQSPRLDGDDNNAQSEKARSVMSSSSSQRASLVARQKAAEARLKRKLAQISHQVAAAEEVAARAEFEAESAAVEAEEAASTASSKRTADWINSHCARSPSPSHVQPATDLIDTRKGNSESQVEVPYFTPVRDDEHRARQRSGIHYSTRPREDILTPVEAQGLSERAAVPTTGSKPQTVGVEVSELCRLTDAVLSLAQGARPLCELPLFSGDIGEWVLFKKTFDDTSSSYSSRQNVTRLRSALRGAAREIVKSLLILCDEPDSIMKALELNFARPEQIILHEIALVRALPKMGRDSNDIFMFSAKIQNCISVIKLLNKHEYIYSPEIVHSILHKLSFYLQQKWLDFADQHCDSNQPMLELLTVFLQNEASKQARFSPHPILYSGGGGAAPMQMSRQKPSHHVGVDHRIHSNTVNTSICLFCHSDHCITTCPKFSTLSAEERWSWVRQHRLCHKCLKNNKHNWRTCKTKSCSSCNKHHHSLLHLSSPISQNSQTISYQHSLPSTSISKHVNNNVISHVKNDSVNHGITPAFHNAGNEPASSTGIDNPVTFLVKENSAARSRAYLKIVPVIVAGPCGEVHTFALLDDGSTTTLIDNELSDTLGLVGPEAPIFVGGITGSRRVNSKQVSFKIKGNNSSEFFDISNARSMPNLKLTSQSINFDDISRYQHLRDIAHELSFDQATPKLLIGICDWHLLISVENRLGSLSQPAASKTALGWVLYGGQTRLTQVNKTFFNNCETSDENDELVSLIRDYYNLDSIGIRQQEQYTAQEQRAIKIVEQTTRRLANGRFEVGLPWREDDPQVPDSYYLALSRLNSLTRHFMRDNNYLDLYSTNIGAYVEKDYAEECLDSHQAPAENNRRWYLPHFGVTNINKPGKLRIVHDAAAQSQSTSLNSLLLPGPDMLQSLLGILLRFREGQVALTGDIREMFPQIKIRNKDRDCQRYLWRACSSEPVKEFRMSSLIFGASCSPFIAIYIKNRNAREFESQFPEATNAIIKNHYMDDYLGTFDDVDQAARVAAEIVNVHSRCGFEMRSWVSNNPEALKLLPLNLIKQDTEEVNLSLESIGLRVLGMHWLPRADVFIFKINFSQPNLETLTKRHVLKDLMKVFDPLGFLCPIVTSGKILFQRTWQLVKAWDDILPSNERSLWGEWYNSVASVKTLSIPRPYFNTTGACTRELHIFTDASNQAYSCAAYWRFLYADDSVKIAFIMSKSRVAPLKPVSVPRLELQAALLGVRMARTILEQQSFKPSKRYFWCDSRTVLAWIRGATSDANTFVRNRIGEIAELTLVHEWFWIPTEANVADDATRGSTKGVESLERWLKGPDFLLSNVISITEPSDHTSNSSLKLNELSSFPVNVASLKPFNIIANPDRFSSWPRLLRSTARAHQFLRLLRQKATSCTRKGLYPLHAYDLKNAEIHLLRHCQEDLSPNQLKNLPSKLDAEGLLRLDGRIARASGVPESMKQPVILNGKHHISRLLVKHYHVWAGHGGRELVVNEIRQRYWITRLRPTVRAVAASCQICRNRKAAPFIPPFADLPEDRLLHHNRPFSVTGLDYFGPVEVTIGRRREKRWIALFTCFSSRAVHLEIVSSLSADSAIMALRRFMARRGCPIKVYSDNGTAFIGANRQIKREWQSQQSHVQDFAVTRQIDWHFLPPAAPSMGGVWERLVGCVKRTLASVLRERAPREEVLSTLLLEAESIVNSRPLTHVSVEVDDAPALTPNHFLIGQSSTLPGPVDLTEEDLIRRVSWKKVLRLADHFWKRWVKEYLPVINPRRQRNLSTGIDNLAVGDIVIICDVNAPRGLWPKGKVSKVYTGKDGVVRVADVTTVSGVLKRPVRKLVKLAVA